MPDKTNPSVVARMVDRKLGPNTVPNKNPDKKTLLNKRQLFESRRQLTPGFFQPITERISNNIIVVSMPVEQWLAVGYLGGKKDPQAVACGNLVRKHPELVDEHGMVTLQRVTEHQFKRFKWMIPSKSTMKVLAERRAENPDGDA